MTALASDGRAVVEPENTARDTVEVEVDAEDTVEDALGIFFATQGSELKREDWEIKALNEERVLKDVYPETKPAAQCSLVALLKKRR